MEISHAGLCLLLLAGAASAQTTHLVGPGGFPQVNDALAVAAPGDEIVVLPGTYAPATVTFTVTIRAAVPGTVVLSPVGLAVNRVDLAQGQRVQFVGLTWQSLWVTGGTAMLDDCTVMGTSLVALRAQTATIVLQHCRVTGVGLGPRAAFDAVNCDVTAIDSTFIGQNTLPPPDYSLPGIAIRIEGGVFHGSNLVATGGSGSLVTAYYPAPALRAINGVVYVSDSQLKGGSYLYGSGPQICAVDAAAGRLDRCTLAPAGCPIGIPVAGPLLGSHRLAPMQSPGAFAMDYRTTPNGLLGVYLADDVAPFLVTGLEQPVWLDAASLRPLVLLVANGQGLASLGCTIPPGLTNRTFWFQAIAPGAPLQLSPVAGGAVR